MPRRIGFSTYSENFHGRDITAESGSSSGPSPRTRSGGPPLPVVAGGAARAPLPRLPQGRRPAAVRRPAPRRDGPPSAKTPDAAQPERLTVPPRRAAACPRSEPVPLLGPHPASRRGFAMEVPHAPSCRASSRPCARPRRSPPRRRSPALFAPPYGPAAGWWHDDPAEQLRNYRSWVYAAVNAIAQEAARHKPFLYMNTGQADHEQSPLPHTHPLCRLLDRPEPVAHALGTVVSHGGVPRTHRQLLRVADTTSLNPQFSSSFGGCVSCS